jgi:hypothetical protein
LFFYTNIPSYYEIYKNDENVYIKKRYPPYAIFYHTIDILGEKDHKICYISYNGSTCYPLYANKSKYFALLLATFFPYKEIEEKKIFFTNKYTIKELCALKTYVNSFQEKELMLPAELKKHIRNKAIYALFLHSIVHTRGTDDFYAEINRNISLLVNLKKDNQNMA